MEEKETMTHRSTRYISTTKMPLRDAKGEIIGTFGISRDITEQKKMQDDLVLAKEKAEESNRLKTAFLHNISHEIRTPLNAIIGFSTFLTNSELTLDKRKEFINIINTSNDQLLSIISGVIAMATLDAGQERIVEMKTDINQILQQVYQQFLLNKVSDEVTFSYHPSLPNELAVVLTDPVKLMQVLVNLVENALKFTHKGHVRFGYTLIKNALHFFVEDTGIGIAEEMHEVIFERFRQVDNSATRRYGGTGLGLALSKGYVKMLGGSIKLNSAVGKGSVFSFNLPYRPVKEKRTAETNKTGVSGLSFPKEKKILVTEDDYNNYQLINEMLTSMNLKVIWAQNGVEALSMCKSGILPDLILMDIKMPLMDGVEATKRIKELKPGLPIIALTAYTMEAERKLILESGCDDYLEKPVKQESLFNSLLKYLSV
jgi:signal transduction histidine kinase